MKKLIPKYVSHKNKTVGVIGAGWFGSYSALSLATNFTVELLDSKKRIFSGISGKFGVRIHTGPHYPQSKATRDKCHSSFFEFISEFPDLINRHFLSIYALGENDVDGNKSKTDISQFREVCGEFRNKGELKKDSTFLNSKEILAAFDMKEPSAIVGPRLREYFEKKLNEKNVTIRCNFKVKKIYKYKAKHFVSNGSDTIAYDYIINATSFKEFLPTSLPLPFDMKVVYQPCLALIYEDLDPTVKPISFITMDGLWPCLMPYDDRSKIEKNKKKQLYEKVYNDSRKIYYCRFLQIIS